MNTGADLGGGGRVHGARTLTRPEMTCSFLIQLVFCKRKTMWFIGVEVVVHPLLKKILDPPLEQYKGASNIKRLINIPEICIT